MSAAEAAVADDETLTTRRRLDPRTWPWWGKALAVYAVSRVFTTVVFLWVATAQEKNAWTDARFEAMGAKFGVRFDAVDARFDAVDARFDAVDARFDAVDARFDAVDGRFDGLIGEVRAQGERLTRVEERLVGVEHAATQLRGDVDHLTTTMTPIVDELLRAGVTGRPRAAG